MKAEELKSLIVSLGFDIKYAARDIMICCPFHGERNPSLGISVVKQGHSWGCFSCGVKGRSVVSFVASYLEISSGEAKKLVSKYGVVELPDEDYILEREEAREKLEGEYQRYLEDSFDDVLIKARGDKRYHNLSDEILRKAKVGYNAMDGTFVIPWPTLDNSRHGFTSHGGSRKVKMLPVGLFKFKDVLYHPFPNELKNASELIVVEGVADALRVCETGKLNVAAIAGTILTESQATYIKRMGVRSVVTLFDPDFAGRKVVMDFVRRLPGVWVFEGRLKSNDPAESKDSEILEAITKARLVL